METPRDSEIVERLLANARPGARARAGGRRRAVLDGRGAVLGRGHPGRRVRRRRRGRARGRRSGSTSATWERVTEIVLATIADFARDTARTRARLARSFAGHDELWLKREDVHHLGMFKARRCRSSASSRRGSPHRRHVPRPATTEQRSRGRVSQGVRSRAVVFVPPAANQRKLALLAELGADVRVAGNDLDDAKHVAKVWARSKGCRSSRTAEPPSTTRIARSGTRSSPSSASRPR